MNNRMWMIVGASVLVLVLGAGSFFIEEEIVVPIKTDTEMITIEPEGSKEVQPIKKETKDMPVATLVEKKTDATSYSDNMNKGSSTEEFMERVEERKETLARERGEAALESYYAKKEGRIKRVRERTARKEASKAHREKVNTWRSDLSSAKASGDVKLINELKDNRPKRRSHDDTVTDTREGNGQPEENI